MESKLLIQTILIRGIHRNSARMLTWVEQNEDANQVSTFLDGLPKSSTTPVIGLTGTGGAGKSCLTDELVRRFPEEFPERRVAVVSVDPSKRKTGGALWRPHAHECDSTSQCFHAFPGHTPFPSGNLGIPSADPAFVEGSSFDLILVETAGIGQSDTEITDLADLSVYVMTRNMVPRLNWKRST